MSLPPGLLHIIAQTRLFSDGKTYVILRIGLSQARELESLLAKLVDPFSAYVRDKDEVTLVLSQEVWAQVQPQVDVLGIAAGYRLITFDLPLDLGLVGYLATLSAAIAEVGVSIYPVAAFSRDHILVAEADFDRAWAALHAYIRSCQVQESEFSL